MKTVTYKNTYGNGEVKTVDYLVADEGKQLTNGTDFASAIPMAESEGWSEVDTPAPDEEATFDDALDALKELGVKTND